MKAKQNYSLNNIAGQWMLIATDDGTAFFQKIFSLNETGHILWNRLQTSCSFEELVSHLLQEYPELDEKKAEADITAFLEEANKMSLIEEI